MDLSSSQSILKLIVNLIFLIILNGFVSLTINVKIDPTPYIFNNIKLICLAHDQEHWQSPLNRSICRFHKGGDKLTRYATSSSSRINLHSRHIFRMRSLQLLILCCP
jgi:hypothetical protein